MNGAEEKFLNQLARSGPADALARLLKENPPQDWKTVGAGIGPLWQADGETLNQFFEALGEGYLQPSTLPVLLDLANYAARTKRTSKHLLEPRQETLSRLLRDVVIRLEKLESNPRQYGESVEEIQRVLDDSVALTLSLCDALGLIRRSSAAESLASAMDLSHRRIQTEAAAALVRLGDSRGKERLVELAQDPAARCRAVHYAEELQIANEIPEEFRSAPALAESELAGWLAKPEQFGVPPTTIERIDTRTMYWPGYDEPRDCTLFRFEYKLAGSEFASIGIVGPLVHTFAVSLNDFTLEDCYAAFAGWHAEHAEIFEVPARSFTAESRLEAQALSQTFERDGDTVESLICLAFTLGEVAVVVELNRNGRRFAGVSNGETFVHIALQNNRPEAVTEVALAIHRGRKLLQAFNP